MAVEGQVLLVPFLIHRALVWCQGNDGEDAREVDEKLGSARVGKNAGKPGGRPEGGRSRERDPKVSVGKIAGKPGGSPEISLASRVAVPRPVRGSAARRAPAKRSPGTRQKRLGGRKRTLEA